MGKKNPCLKFCILDNPGQQHQSLSHWEHLTITSTGFAQSWTHNTRVGDGGEWSLITSKYGANMVRSIVGTKRR